MDLEEYLNEIAGRWPQPGQSPTKEVLDLCLEAVDRYPESSTLWYDLGTIMQRCSEDAGYRADDYLRCFQNAVRQDPTYAEAYQELGYVLDAYFAEFDKAEDALRTAIELGAGWESYYGRARVLAQMGKAEDALFSLSANNCPFSQHPEIEQLRADIADGVWQPRDPRRDLGSEA